ncbi:MAG: hypothetical protein LBJ36_03505 [Synergistaceae bacterium]|jgi:hypothetical protein|nr:hypothetical protein [Synergistaceae bacterium]
MRRNLVIALLFLFLAPGSVLADYDIYDISGPWFIEGGGFVEKGIARVEMTLDGTLDMRTQIESGDQYFLGFSLAMQLNASKLNINAWRYSKVVILNTPVKVPELAPTMSNSFKLPPVSVDGLVYEVTFTSTTSGIVKISGYIDVDIVGQVEISSESAIWKKNSPKPDISNKASGCNSGFWEGWVIVVMLFGAKTRV